ncbi:MAG: SMP-30/gluconolactonase/LRE family protein [Pseudomonadota bacterium]|nr:SMP-30/gluconolactonase/LRE family protein [Pseudomonadota bacterium]
MNGITIVEPRFKSFVLPNAPLERLGEGFRWLEGPVWFADLQCLLVSDLPNNRIMRWTASGGMSVFREPSQFANGHARDMQGRLIGCSHGDRCLLRTELDGTITVLADRYRGKRLNSPNDVVVKSDGTVWFSDPVYGLVTDYEGGKRESELPAALYRFDPRDGSLDVMADDFQGPNGLCFSPDEQLLYVSESGLPFATDPVQHLRVFAVEGDGSRLANPRVFYKVEPGFTDGVRCDEDGNLWSSAGDGVHCISPEAELLGKIAVPAVVSNLCFGGRHRSRLFICGSQSLYAMYVNKRGAQRP